MHQGLFPGIVLGVEPHQNSRKRTLVLLRPWWLDHLQTYPDALPFIMNTGKLSEEQTVEKNPKGVKISEL